MEHALRRAAAAFPVFALAASAAIAGQQAPAVVQESARVTVIEIPVNVVGKDGKPVANLRAEDFELYDEGKRQPISGFDVIDLSKAPAPAAKGEAAEEVPASARRLWLIVFDLSYTNPSALLRARDGARDFVTRSMGADDLAAVGTLSVDTGWKLLVNFTRDRRQLDYAVDTLGLPALAARTPDPLSFALLAPNPSGSPTGGLQSLSGAGSKDALMLENLRDLQTMQRQANDDLARGRVLKLINSLAGIGRVLDTVRGRKHVLFFSEGFATRLLAGNAAGGGRGASLQQPMSTSAYDTSTSQGAGESAISGEIWRIDSDARFGSSSTRDVLSAALAWFNRSDAVLDTVDTSGLAAEGDVGAAQPGSGTDALFTMASETSGDFVRNANQLGGELGKVAERTALVYLLAYQPKNLSKPGAFHRLQIKVKAAGKVFARSGYYEPRPYDSLSPFEKLLASGDLVTGGEREQGLAAHLLTASFASPADLPQVPIVLEIPGSSLLAGDTGDKAGVQIYAYANDSSGTLADYVASEMTLDLTKLRPSLESGGIKYYGTLYLPPGDYSVRALVRNATTGRSGVFSARVRVPRMPGGRPAVLPPFFSEPAGQWVMVRGNPRADAPARPFDYPFAVAGDSFVPAALPVLSNDKEEPVAVFTYNFARPDEPAPLAVRCEVVGPDGKTRAVELRVVKESDFERGGGRKLLLAFKPQGLARGRYTLRVAVTDPASKASSENASAFEVK